MYAYAHATLDDESISLSTFSSGYKLNAFIRDFYCLIGLTDFFSPNKLSLYFRKIIDQGYAFVHIDGILLFAHTKTHMLDLFEPLHQI